MAERAYNINVTLKAEAKIAPIKETEKAIQGVDAAAQKTTENISKTGTALEGQFKALRESIEKTRDEIAKPSEGADSGAGGGLKESLSAGLDKVLSGDLMAGAGAAAGAAGAWGLGQAIGGEILRGFENWAQGGTWGEFWAKTWQRVADASGIDSWSFPGKLKAVMTESNMILAANRLEWQQWIEEVEKADPQDATQRLEKLADSINKAKTALTQLMEVEAARRRANSSEIDQNEADALQALELDPVLNPSDKTTAAAQIRANAERQRLAQRTQGRENEATASRAGVGVAQAEVNRAKQLEAAEMERARQFNEIKQVADQAGAGLEGEAAQKARDQAFQTEAKRRGSDLTPDYNKEAQMEAAKKARIEAEQKLETAKAQDVTTRQKLAIEQGSDISATERKIERDRVKSWTQSEAQSKAEQAAQQRPQEELPPSSEDIPYDRSGEDQARGVLNELGQTTNNQAHKSSYDQMAGALKDNNTGADEVAKMEQLAENLAKSAGENGTRLAEILTDAIAKINASNAARDAAQDALRAQVDSIVQRNTQ